MFQQYPHYLFVRVVAESIQDNDGNWVNNGTGEDSWQLHSVCREETNGKGQKLNMPDGRQIVYSSTVYMPKSVAPIKEGTQVVISHVNDPEDMVRIAGQVLKFEVGQLNRRLWV